MRTIDDLTDAGRAFLTERHLAVLVTTRADGSPHAVPVGFSFTPRAEPGGPAVVRIITFASAVKARNAGRGGRASVCQVDGGRWLTLDGDVTVTDDPERVALAVSDYAARYRDPKRRSDRVAIEIAVDRVMGSASLVARHSEIDAE
jgi:PPOX class probable F420-dependent enzyme